MDLINFRKALPKGVNLLAVSKGQSDNKIRNLVSKGQLDFGESRLQDALPKLNALKDLNIKWHFIGSLQANKVRPAVKAFEVIHSIDSTKLVKRVSRIAGEEGKKPQLMLQVKFREDPQKFGFNSENLMNDWDEIIQLPNVDVIGLMTISPISLDLKERKNLFRECRSLADKLQLKECSMGMSGDWEEAVEAGATWIRLGSLLFGSRPQPKLKIDINKLN